jgi:hypothetical protein
MGPLTRSRRERALSNGLSDTFIRESRIQFALRDVVQARHAATEDQNRDPLVEAFGDHLITSGPEITPEPYATFALFSAASNSDDSDEEEGEITEDKNAVCGQGIKMLCVRYLSNFMYAWRLTD